MANMQHSCTDEACEILIAADFTMVGERAYRLAQDIRSMASNGDRVGLVQIRKPTDGAIIAAEIQTCVRRGHARVLSPLLPFPAQRLVIHEPSRADWSLPVLQKILARDVVLVCYVADDFGAGLLLSVRARFTWHYAPVNPFVRSRAKSNRKLLAEDWLPALPAAIEALPGKMGVPAVGWIGDPHAIAQIGSVKSVATCATPEAPEPLHFLLGVGDKSAFGGGAATLGPMSLDRLVRGLDVLAVLPSEATTDLPDTIIAWALAAGAEVVLPSWLERHYGPGPRYAAPGEFATAVSNAVATVRRVGRRDLATGLPDFAARCQKPRQSPDAQPQTGAPRISARSVPRGQSGMARPTLCLAANGVGVGHLTRLLAIARRMDGDVVFASQVPALEILHNYGFLADYIPSAATVGGDFALWDSWFGAHLNRLLDRYDPELVVYDGNHPSWGLIGSVASRRDCGLAWIRRGMWANTSSAHLGNARWCDLVIEPGELAGDRDQGVTAGLKHEALQVDPIRLLEVEELFDRTEAAQRLGLDPRRPAALIQLGSGHNRDLLSLLDQIVGMLSGTPGLQIAVAEWVNGTIPLTLWPGVKVLRGFPISQYLRAFDFCISAAGYNSFHELIGYGVPTIFMANRHPTMDDQYNRAKFAQDNAAAFEISENDLHDLPDLVKMLMQGRPREFLAGRCRDLLRANGAVAAAQKLHAQSRNAKHLIS